MTASLYLLYSSQTIFAESLGKHGWGYLEIDTCCNTLPSLSDLSLSVDTLEERVVKIKAYAVSAYRSNGSLYPYLIVTDFEYIKGRSRIDNDLQHAYTVKQVEKWIDRVQQNIRNLDHPVSKTYPSSGKGQEQLVSTWWIY